MFAPLQYMHRTHTPEFCHCFSCWLATCSQECLLDDERRAVYDETGLVGDESETAERFAGKSFDELRRYFRELNPAVTTDAIDEYEAKYRGSDEEVADLVAFYTRYDGCMQNATECVLFAEESDLHRFKLILDAQIAAGKLVITSEYAKFNPPPGPSTAEVVRRAKAKVKAGGRKGGGAKSGGGSSSGAAGEGDEASLFAMIRGRQASRAEAHDAMVDALAAKYAPKAGPSVGGKAARRGVQKSSKSKAAKGK